MSGLPFSDMYRNSGRLEDQLLPTSNAGAGGGSGGGLGALARSASLSARKKDPYMYSSDDVESGLGNMDVSDERSWGIGGHVGAGGGVAGGYPGGQGYHAGGYGQGRGQMGQTQLPFATQQQPTHSAHPPSSAGPGRSPLASTFLQRGALAANGNANAGTMQPPPPPLALHTRPTAARGDSGESASSAREYDHAGGHSVRSSTLGQQSPYTPSTAHLQAQQAQAQAHGHAQAQAHALASARAQASQAQAQVGQQHGAQQSPYNPYIPLGNSRVGSDPASAPAPPLSAGGSAARESTWEYRSIVPPRERIPSSSSHHSHYSELSPFSHPNARLPSPSSPMMNPYEPYPTTPGSAGLGGYYASSSGQGTARQESFGQQGQVSGHMQGHGAIGEERKDSAASQYRNSSTSSRSHSQSHAAAQGLALPSSSPMSVSGSGMNTPWSSYAPSPDALAPLVPPQQAQLPHAQSSMPPPQAPLQQRPNGGRSQSSHNTAYAASQPVTPANKYPRAPPQTATGAYGKLMQDEGRKGADYAMVGHEERGRSGRGGHEQDGLQAHQYQQPHQAKQSMQEQPIQGFRDVDDLSDLMPVRNERPVGRRADPMRPGKFISPLQCLTGDIAQTYTLCNPQFRYESSDNPRRVLTKPSKPVHNDGADNEDWDYILYVNDILGGENGGDRYLILDVLGQGTFGQVVKCQNLRTHDIVAVKVVKNKPAYLNQSKMEVAILDLLNNQWDPHDQHHILRMLDSFNHKNHLCLVFECLSSNLYELIKQNQFKGLSLQLVKVFTAQLLECLGVLKDARLIHCDLKPENILLKSLQSPQIKIIDFGSACHEMQTVYTYIQSRFYRSPEVLLGLPYSTSIDMWSLGCIVVELFLGLPLFPGTSEYNQLSRIVDMLGNPPSHLLEVGKQTHEFYRVGFDHQGRKTYDLKSMEQYATEHRTNEQPSKQYFKQRKLDDIIMQYAYSKKNPKPSDMEKEMAQRTAFVDFVKGLINLDPIKRWSPQQAAKHPFVTGEKYTGPYQPSANPVNHKKATPSPMASPTTPSKKSYGGISQSHQPSPSRTNRIYSDAGTYAQTTQTAYTPQTARQNTGAGSTPYSPTSYESGHRGRLPSQSHVPPQQPSQQQQWQPMGPPANYQPRMLSQNMGASASHGQLRPAGLNMPSGGGMTNPPPNSYYPATRNRANTINQMDAIPPALARLTHMSMPDPSGQRNLTPVLNRGDDAYREWERRQQGGHSKNSSLAQTSYPQLEYLQEQAELVGGGWMMPAPAHTQNRQPSQGMGMGGMYAPPPPTSYGQSGHGHTPGASYGGAGHRTRPSAQMGPNGPYQMQPPIPPQQRQQTSSSVASSPYDPPGNRAYLPTFPPPAATTSHGHAHSLSMSSGPPMSSTSYDGYDNGAPSHMMYTPVQSSYPHSPGAHGQASPYGAGHGGQGNGQGMGQGYGTQGLGIIGHQTRASFSGPFSPAGLQGQSQNPFVQQQQAQQQHGQGQGGGSPRYQRRSQQYGV